MKSYLRKTQPQKKRKILCPRLAPLSARCSPVKQLLSIISRVELLHFAFTDLLTLVIVCLGSKDAEGAKLDGEETSTTADDSKSDSESKTNETDASTAKVNATANATDAGSGKQNATADATKKPKVVIVREPLEAKPQNLDVPDLDGTKLEAAAAKYDPLFKAYY